MKSNPGTLRETNFEAAVTRFGFSWKFGRKSKRNKGGKCVLGWKSTFLAKFFAQMGEGAQWAFPSWGPGPGQRIDGKRTPGSCKVILQLRVFVFRPMLCSNAFTLLRW
jgi:hypothetical protein